MIPSNRSNPNDPSRTHGPSDDRHDESHGFELSAMDQAALEAVFGDVQSEAWAQAQALTTLDGRAKSVPGLAPEPRPEPRIDRCVALLGLLGCGPTPAVSSSLIDATVVRAARLRQLETEDLSPIDEDALEALVAAGFDPSRCPGGVRDRATRHAETLRVLELPVAGHERDALVSSTLSFVQSSIERSERGRKLSAQSVEGTRWRPSVRWGDLASVAALLLIAGAVLAPMVGAMRGVAQATSCQAGMFGTMRGFAAYANDYREMLPMASASAAGRSWWNIGKREESNSANLFTIVRSSYAKTSDLACPGNAMACRSEDRSSAEDWSNSDEISYSYQNMFAKERPRWTQPQTVIVLADRSPVTVRAMRGEWFNPIASSDNHMQRGQNALMNDGSVHWLRTPVVARGGLGGGLGAGGTQMDNIWLPQALEDAVARFQNPNQTQPLQGNESPAGAMDVFLSP
ncbi:MAG: hypothetical protein K2W85_14730 [Phycisphaerales bacterium]|nr:hypothetical protein [Phycisphaerales bacterium]